MYIYSNLNLFKINCDRLCINIIIIKVKQKFGIVNLYYFNNFTFTKPLVTLISNSLKSLLFQMIQLNSCVTFINQVKIC